MIPHEILMFTIYLIHGASCFLLAFTRVWPELQIEIARKNAGHRHRRDMLINYLLLFLFLGTSAIIFAVLYLTRNYP